MRFALLAGAVASMVLCSCANGEAPLSAATPTTEQGLGATFLATADTTINSEAVNTNVGTLALDARNGVTGQKISLVRFNGTSIASKIGNRTVATATLQLRIGTVDTANLDSQFIVHALNTSSWTEMGATWKCGTDTNTADNLTRCAAGTAWNFDSNPPYGATSTTTSIGPNATGWASFNVLPMLTAGLQNGWVIRRPSSLAGTRGATFYPREVAQSEPRLVLTYATVCGDGAKDAPEQCDDGNTTAGDGCSSTCALETWSEGVVVPGEVDAGLGSFIEALAFDSGRLYAVLGDPRNLLVEVLPDGQTRIVAGNGSTDNESSSHAASNGLNNPIALATRAAVLYVSEGNGKRITAIAPDGSQTLVAGNGSFGFSGDGGPATAASIRRVTSMAFGSDGSLYLADSENNRVRRVSPAGIITTIAGTGTAGFTGDGGPATSAQIEVEHLALEANGNIIIGGGNRLRRIATNGTITSIAGTGIPETSGDGGLAVAASIVGPLGLAIAPDGAIHFSGDNNIRRISSAGTITTICGNGLGGSTGDGGPATAARTMASRLAFDSNGLTLVDFLAGSLRRIDTSGVIRTVVRSPGSFAGDGGAAVSAVVSSPAGAVQMPDGSVVITDTSNNRIRRIAVNGTISTIAGDGVSGTTGDGGPASAARVSFPQNLVRSGDGSLFFVDGGVSVRRINAAGIISTAFVGGGVSSVFALAVSSTGVLFMATENAVFRLESNGTRTAVAGGTTGTAGDGGPALSAQFLEINALAVAPDGSLRVADGSRIRKVVIGGTVSTIAGSANTFSASGDNGPATAATFATIFGLSFLSNGNLLVGDTFNFLLRQISPSGIVSAFGGGGSPSFLEDGKPLAGGLFGRSSVSATPDGGAIVATYSGVRRFSAAGVATSLTSADPLGSGPLPNSSIPGVTSLVMYNPSRVYAAVGSRVMRVDTATGVEVVAGYNNDRFTGEPSARYAAAFRKAAVAVIPGIGDIVVASELEQRLLDLNTGAPTTWPISNVRSLSPTQRPLAMTATLQSQTPIVWWTAPSCVLTAGATGGAVTTLAGSCTAAGYADGAATTARFNAPEGITVLNDGTVYVSDTRNHRVRRIRGGTVTTIIGTGLDDNTGAEGSVASSASISSPRQLTVDVDGHLYIAAGDAVRMIADDDGDGLVDGGDPVYTVYSGGRCIRAVAAMDDHRLWVGDACDGSIIELTN